MGSLMLSAICWRVQLAWSSRRIRALARLGLVLGSAGLLAGCWEPLYGRSPPSAGGESVADKLAEVLIPPIPVRQGTPEARLAVDLRFQWRRRRRFADASARYCRKAEQHDDPPRSCHRSAGQWRWRRHRAPLN